MSKTIPTLPSQGKQTLLNVRGSTPTGGRTLQAGVPVMQSWNPHNAVAASGQQNAVPAETVSAPVGTIPGRDLPNPATAVPGEAGGGWTQEHENPLVVAGRDAGIQRESAPASAPAGNGEAGHKE
jgi:hypothetical protein